MRKSLLKKTSVAALLLCAAIGVFLGLSSYTFVYAKGFSYLSTNPQACANCHIMQQQYDGWLKSSHHTAATCADCHVPHSFLAKYYIKSENGFLHSTAFTLQNFHEPITIRDSSKRILNKNCLHCHESMVGQIAGHEKTESDPNFCTRCHGSVGH